MSSVGENIRLVRIKAGISQEELAKAVGVTKSTISKYELDKRQLNYEQIKAIAEALGVPPYVLMDGSTFVGGGIFRVPHTIAIDTDKINKELGIDEAEEERINQLVDVFLDLNEYGQQKAIERVEELAEIPKYQKEEPPQD